ncbi:UbiH/UbiF/VisC/COQ6 family ubiquinone biosynthesis hydroxylase [Paracoccus aerodenitrificans]|uniref:UbiH/UbiF/VisC/COQ6 family ubiquinone biosynthesis hydroxylase n=1 Tax=Paracoccus aerodenitrificans TaxID=3017781 RepID=UPI0022F0458D|nr:UbiH/UbiF/VisC/COQ6 family ubiquinone biosynthesis hydroxylase [Paracoccus aerodenitrificans]WBU64050.1 UbiH/UbiF/VisC/COQ6 family ubiquinone biosynthesis hydroxylase [Paracoccus aerodenitrificans]
MKNEHDVVIAGGGLNGPALGLALVNAGLNVAVVDAAPERARSAGNFDGRAYALALSSVRLLQGIGIWQELAGQSQPITKVVARQGRQGDIGPFGLFFDGAEIEEGLLGHMLEDRFLYRALLAAMQERLSFLPGTKVIAQQADPGGINVSLSDGRVLRARLLVGADGRRSGVAERAGIDRTGWDYGQTALVAALDQSNSHDGTAHQIFLPTGPLAVLPLPGKRSSVVWSLTRSRAETIAALDDADFLSVLSPHLSDIFGDISLAGPRFSYPLSLTLANSYVAERVALIGDAAHGVHPIAGQGLNLGLRDVAALAESIVDAMRNGEDIGFATTLDRYQGWRRFDATTLALGMDSVNRLFSNESRLLASVRGMGMGAINAVPPLRRRFMRQAAGLSIDPMPRLLSGRPL